ncbi:hypothetical protein ACFFYR_18450 [Paraburkholderia dipogonis]|uniref:hypothetical protein n=1 Tax=Paraburkholderia dipogonis TaxID=1211383 RepID=UPI0035ECC9E9
MGKQVPLVARRGVDHVIEVGGPWTFAAVEVFSPKIAGRIGGPDALSSCLPDWQGPVPDRALMARQQRLQGLIVGSRQIRVNDPCA